MKPSLRGLCAILCVGLCGGGASGQISRPRASSSPQYSSPSGEKYLVEFEVRTGLGGLGGSSGDGMLIIFSNRSADTPLVPFPLFGEDIIAEFAFSGRDAIPGKVLAFSRRVNDLSFLDARYIRIVNPGADGWAGESLSLTVAGKRVLDRQTLYPRKGAEPKGGIEMFNSSLWSARKFWEADLQRIRIDK